MLRKISLVLNSIIVVLSLLLFGYTFFAKTHLVEHTRSFVAEKTLSYSAPLVDFMRVGLKSPLSHKLISDEHRSNIEAEIAAYDSNPSEYISSLTSQKTPSFGTGKVADFKRNAHSHYQSILEGLVRDLRIFSGSNAVAGMVAICLLRVSISRNNRKVTAFSFILFAAVAFSTYSYLEGVSFMRILLNSHLGWWYPAGLVVMIVSLVLEQGLHAKKNEEPDAP